MFVRTETIELPGRTYQLLADERGVLLTWWGMHDHTYHQHFIPTDDLRPPSDLPVIDPEDMVGCWLDGNQGWRNSYRVVDRATEYGFHIPHAYREALTWYRNSYGGYVYGENTAVDDTAAGHWELINGQGELSDMATDYLQERCPPGYEMHWDAGELSLLESWNVCAGEGNGCTDETRCADHEETV